FVACTKSTVPATAAFAPGRGLRVPAYKARLSSRNRMDFESGNIGMAERTARDAFELSLRSDNDDALPPFWRNWFYVKLTDVPVATPVTVTIKGAGIPSFYVPVYSYEVRPDRRNADAAWRQFRVGDVSQPSGDKLVVTGVFEKSQVWLARWHPYTYTR